MSFVVAIAVACFFAMNIGASGAAASMGVAYGSGAVSRRRVALLLCGVGVILGATIGGGEVVKTVGEGIVPSNLLSVEVAVIILASACLSLFIANLIGIPLSTSEVTVGAVVGVGIAFQALYLSSLTVIVAFWLLTPVTAFILAFVAGKGIQRLERAYPALLGASWKRWLTLLVVVTGFLEAFSAGMNNVANAIGPLVGAQLLSVDQGIWIGGLFVALGALLLGGKVLETNGKRITRFSLLEGSAISGTGAALVITASLWGIPVPLTQVTTSAIIGIGTAQKGLSLWQKGVIVQMAQVWVVSPVFSLAIAYGLVQALIHGDGWSVVAVSSVFLATVGSVSLLRSVRQDKQSVHEHGGGI
ncbi:inorganic phosphate transporter [Desmospora activa]|uniref:Sulfate permease n=1 Tax=Desmospora activa DSM 45169 TaxID=1121389 RepID=A0A2T4Z844_9BACL|nr:inorganic phosphate transporter [Desmospora activa]PTM58071.1 sulfate permease [Desmospora activa DSM 45169]